MGLLFRMAICCLLGTYFFASANAQMGSILFAQVAEVASADGKDPFSLLANPAASAFRQGKHWALGVEKRMAVPGWVAMMSVITTDSKLGNWGLGFTQDGLLGFHQQRGLLIKAQKLGKEISVGTMLGFQRNSAAGYKATISPIASLGMIFNSSKSFQLGWSITNDFSPTYSKSLRGLKIRAGISFEPSSLIVLRAECLKASGYTASLMAACSYSPAKKIKISLGILQDPQWGWLAVDFRLRSCTFRLQAAWHPLMGMNSGFFLYGNNLAE